MPSTAEEKLRLEPHHWYACQILPGYGEEHSQPYYSPIYVTRVVPRRTGRAILALDFINVLYLDGAQDFSLHLQVLRHHPHYLVADLMQPDKPQQRVCIITPIGFGWLKQHCRHIVEQFPPDSLDPPARDTISAYLDEAFPYVKAHAALPR